MGWIETAGVPVIEADVPPGDRDAEHLAALGEAANRLAELPHHSRVLGGTEVQAVGDGQRHHAITATLRYASASAELGTGQGIEQAVPATPSVARLRPSRLYSSIPEHPGVLAWRALCCRARAGSLLSVTQVTLGQARRGSAGQQHAAGLQQAGRGRAAGFVTASESWPRRPGDGPLIDRALVGGGPWHDVPPPPRPSQVHAPASPVRVTSPISRWPAPPPSASMNAATLPGSTTAVLRSCDSLVRSRRPEHRVTERAGPARPASGCPPARPARRWRRRSRRRRGRRSRPPAPGRVQLQAALHQQLLHERVAHLDARPLGRVGASPNAALASTDAPPIPSGPVREPSRMTCCPRPRPRRLEVVVPHHAHAQRVDQGVPR